MMSDYVNNKSNYALAAQSSRSKLGYLHTGSLRNKGLMGFHSKTGEITRNVVDFHQSFIVYVMNTSMSVNSISVIHPK